MIQFSDAYMWHLRRVNIGSQMSDSKTAKSVVSVITNEALAHGVSGLTSNTLWLAWILASRWRHNEHDGFSNHRRLGCLPDRLFRRRSKETPLYIIGLCVGNHRWPVDSPHRVPVTRKMFPFNDVIMAWRWVCSKPLSKPVAGIHVVEPLTEIKHDLTAQI